MFIFLRLYCVESHDLVVISLELHNLKRLFLEKPSILDFLKNRSPNTRVYVFGASSIINRIEKNSGIHLSLYPRLGVAKLTCELKNDLIDYIKRK